MGVEISQDELVHVMARDFPREYQICVLTVAGQAQARRIAELERRLKPAQDPALRDIPSEQG